MRRVILPILLGACVGPSAEVDSSDSIPAGGFHGLWWQPVPGDALPWLDGACASSVDPACVECMSFREGGDAVTIRAELRTESATPRYASDIIGAWKLVTETTRQAVYTLDTGRVVALRDASTPALWELLGVGEKDSFRFSVEPCTWAEDAAREAL